MICGIKMKLSSFVCVCVCLFSMFAFPKSGPLIRHFPSSQSWTSGLESLRWCSCFALSLCGCPCFGGDLIHQKLEMQITSIIWAPVVSSGQWWFPWHVLSIVFEKKLQILVQTNVDMVSICIYAIQTPVFSCKNGGRKLFGTLPTLALLGSESYPSITTVQGRDSAMVCWGPYMCRGCLTSGLDKLLNTAWILCIPWPHCRVGDHQAGIQLQRSRWNV